MIRIVKAWGSLAGCDIFKWVAQSEFNTRLSSTIISTPFGKTNAGSTPRLNHFLKYCRLTLLCLWCVLCWTPQSILGQDVRVAQQRGPYYVGEPMVIQIQVNGVQSNQNVDCRLSSTQLPVGVTVDGPQLGQSTSTFSQIVNGRITSRETVSLKYNYQILADRAGPVTIGPFTVVIDGETQPVDVVEIEFEDLEQDSEMELELALARRKVYVGEQVPLTIRWRFAGDRDGLQFAFSNLQIRSPLFEQFNFIDSEPTTRTTLSLATAQGIVEIDAKVEQERKEGQDYVIVSGQRLLSADQPGNYENIPASCRTQRVIRWGRTVFGDARPREVKPTMARAEPLSFQVLPIPVNDRPASYSGAVGSGFAIEVAANRSVVRVGDPISLEIKLTGSGDLERCSLPPLRSSLDENLFQLPTEVPFGSVIGNTKQYKVDLRVKQSAVRQLPAIDFSWFDPKQEKFVTASSKPIALQVNAAQIVSAADVVASSSNPENAANPSSTSAIAGGSQHSSTGPIAPLNFLGANLAIEKNLPSLIVTPFLIQSQQWLMPMLYLAGIGLVTVGLMVKRFRFKAPQQSQRQSLLKQARGSVQKAERQSPREATKIIADALRQLIAAWPEGNRGEADGIIAECERLGYAPAHHDDSALKSDLVHRALRAIDTFLGK